ncbi:MAG: 16S rRNA (guanine(527)-N(7))-methyltransferase RsmG [Fimbriimonadales bacterium]
MHASIGDWAILEQVQAWGILLDTHIRERLERYLMLLYTANQQMNLTRVPPEQAVGRHLVDSLCLLAVYLPPQGAQVLDIGTGAGLPGIPLAIVRPDLQMTLLDSHGKTVQFLREACAALELDARVVHARAESWAHTPEAREQFDVVVARAVAKMPLLTELMAPFVKIGGVGLALKSAQETDEILQATPAAQALGATLNLHTVSFLTEQGTVSRAIGQLRKEHPTPKQYPRAWKQILNRPLGGKP